MDKETAKNIAIRGANYLARQVNDKGKFIYFRDTTGAPVFGEYNLLRHCGCIWAMSQVNKEFPSELLQKSIFRACGFLISKSKFYTQSGFYPARKGIAKLGGNALASLALYQQQAWSPKVGSVDIYWDGFTRGISTFLSRSAEKLTRIHSKISLESLESIEGFDSEYYPGEAVLALSYSDPKIGLELCRFLSNTRDKIKPIQDHWLLQGIEVLWTKKIKGAQTFLKQYAERLYKEIVNNRYYMDRSIRIACRSEALISYCKMFPKNTEAFAFLEALLETQAHYQVKEPKKIAGAFVESDGTRIDYTQHNVSSFIRFYQM